MKRVPLLALALAAALAPSPAFALATPHRSVPAIPSSNGRAAIAFNVAQSRLTQFLEHPYRYPHAGAETRNFLYDAYPGIRVGASSTWLPNVAATTVEVIPGTGIIHVVRTFTGVTVDEYHFAPIGLPENAAFTIVKATRTSGAGAIDLFQLFNYRVGAGSPNASPDGEGMQWNASRDAFYEYGPSQIAFGHGSIEGSTHHGASPNNPYDSVNAGSNLADNNGPSGAVSNAVCGLQKTLGDLAVGKSGIAGFFSVLDPTGNDAQGAVDRVRTWLKGRTADQVLADELSAWSGWITAAPSGASPAEVALYKQSQATLRMAQVKEPGKPNGQILASLAPGHWNIAWVRDMAYAAVALARSGHAAEAKDAIAFQLGADSGTYTQYVGAPYQISVVRYFGNGSEESDSNADGPNVEFDGFGLFLWELDEYIKASGDTASLATWWPTIKDKVAGVLVKLEEPSGLIAPDSSIWEVHWNGKQRHFAYTTETAALGLCAAAHLASLTSKSDAAGYQAAGEKARDAILPSLRAPDGTIGQSVEAIAIGTGFLDAAALEAINFGLVDPAKHTAHATVASIQKGLVPPSGRGFMRSDVGAWYDSQEWIFVDLRSGGALAATGHASDAASLFQWNVDQATDNFLELSELHDRTTADYAGESPMVGFGAGAYVIALGSRGTTTPPACGAYATETSLGSDAGPEADGRPNGPDGGDVDGSRGGAGGGGTFDAGGGGGGGGAGDDGGTGASDAGNGSGGGGGSSGCDLGPTPARGSRIAPIGALGLLLAWGARRRRRDPRP